jgi:hypothetical protein
MPAIRRHPEEGAPSSPAATKAKSAGGLGGSIAVSVCSIYVFFIQLCKRHNTMAIPQPTYKWHKGTQRKQQLNE